MIELLSLILYILPSYFANSVPVVLGGGMALDLEKKFSDKQRIFGEGKTIRGFIAGVAAGTLVAALVANSIALPFFENKQSQFLAGAAMAFGTMLGDALGSFIKRRTKIKQGKPFFLDTFLFAIVALVLAYPFTLQRFYSFENVLFLLVVTLILHPMFNIIANRLGLKKVPW